MLHFLYLQKRCLTYLDLILLNFDFTPHLFNFFYIAPVYRSFLFLFLSCWHFHFPFLNSCDHTPCVCVFHLKNVLFFFLICDCTSTYMKDFWIMFYFIGQNQYWISYSLLSISPLVTLSVLRSTFEKVATAIFEEQSYLSSNRRVLKTKNCPATPPGSGQNTGSDDRPSFMRSVPLHGHLAQRCELRPPAE